MAPEVPEVFVRWENFTGWILDHTEKFPKSVRFTFAGRIDNLVLDVFERLVEARYTRQRAAILARVNLDLEKLRLLLRLCHARRYLSDGAFEHAIKEIDQVGRMVGGWQKQAKEQA